MYYTNCVTLFPIKLYYDLLYYSTSYDVLLYYIILYIRYIHLSTILTIGSLHTIDRLISYTHNTNMTANALHMILYY